jgi:glucose-6-phosphate 1-epimerase
VSLDPESLNTTIVVTNDGDAAFDFQTLLHTYFKISVSYSSFTCLECNN